MEYKLINNKAENRYEIRTEGSLAYLQYDIKGNKILLTHTIVPKALGGRGIATQLVRKAIADIEKQKMHEVIPVCSFVVKYLEKNAK